MQETESENNVDELQKNSNGTTGSDLQEMLERGHSLL